MTTTGERLKRYWQSQGMLIPFGASQEQITKFETLQQVIIPGDLRDYFLAVNGMGSHSPCDQDQNGFTFFPLGNIRTVKQEAKRIKNESILFSGAESFFIFCDYLTWCWVYAVRLSREPLETNIIVRVGTARKEPAVANSFSEFVDLYTCDSPRLYGGDPEQE